MRFAVLNKFVVTVVLALVAVSTSFVIFWWLLLYVRNSAMRLGDVESKIAVSEEERKVARAAETFLKEQERDLERIRLFSPNKERPVEFIESIESLGKDTGNSIVLDFDEGRSKGANLVFRITVEGTAQSVRQYLRIMELMPYEIHVEDLAFQRLTIANESEKQQVSRSLPTHRLTAVLNIKTF